MKLRRTTGSAPQANRALAAATPAGRGRDPALAAALPILAGVVVLTHWPVLSAQTLTSDDSQYIAENPLVSDLSWRSVGRFFGEVLQPSTVAGYYQPLTMVSLMFDRALGGGPDELRPFHRTNLLLHVSNTLMVSILAYQLFRRPWAAALVGLLFGVHPLTVEPVAWVSERKTLLAAFFALWCVILYVRYARRGSVAAYGACLAAMVLALLSKPTTTPLPLLLVLLDYWPLGRLSRRTLAEKVPFLILAGLAAAITLISQGRTAGVTMPGTSTAFRIPLILFHNIAFYLSKVVWPTRLSTHYPFPDPFDLSNAKVLASLVGAGVLLSAALVSIRWTKAIMAGGLFFFIAVFPTLGVLGFTEVIAADKFVYLPSVGLLMTLAWALTRLPPAAPHRRLPRPTLVVSVGLCCAAVLEMRATRAYLTSWQDAVSFHRRVVSLAPAAASARTNLGFALLRQGLHEQAAEAFRQALRLEQDSATDHTNLAVALESLGQTDEALTHYQQAVRLGSKTRSFQVHDRLNLGGALERAGNLAEALEQYRNALGLDPHSVAAQQALGRLLFRQGQFGDAIAALRAADRLSDSSSAKVKYDLGTVLADTGNLDEAIEYLESAVKLDPGYAQAHFNLANALYRRERIDEALSHYRQALTIEPDFSAAAVNLGTILARTGKAGEAIDCFYRVMRRDPAYPDTYGRLFRLLDDGGRRGEAVEVLEAGLKHDPEDRSLAITLAWVLATTPDPQLRDGPRAVALAEKVRDSSGEADAKLLHILAAAYAEAGRFEDATTTARQALERATGPDRAALAEEIKRALERYARGELYHPRPR